MKALIQSTPCGVSFVAEASSMGGGTSTHRRLKWFRPLVSSSAFTPPFPLSASPCHPFPLLPPPAWAFPPPQTFPSSAAPFTHVRVSFAGGSEVRETELRATEKGGRDNQLSPSRDWLEQRRRVRGEGGFPARAKMAASRARL